MLMVLILLALASASSEINSASAVATNTPICEWDNEAATIWKEVICMEMPEATNSAQTNEQGSSAPDALTTGTPPTMPWNIQVGGVGTEIHDVTTDASGNVFVTGAITSLSDSDAFVAKLDSNGGTLWSYPFTGMSYDDGKQSLWMQTEVFLSPVRLEAHPTRTQMISCLPG
jgi:hypothetical protein